MVVAHEPDQAARLECVRTVVATGRPREARPRPAAWFEAVAARPSVRETLPREGWGAGQK